MSAIYEICEKQGVLVVKIEGDPEVSDITQALDQIRDESGYRNLARLWDFRNATFNFSVSELEEIAAHAASADLERTKVAMLVSQDLSFGVSRMYRAYRQNEFTDVNVFKDESEAIKWLLE
ncbi:MAG: hypothetical protein LJE94_10070 [Deltaproteobacteria bacterium]|nr:hypothetical protein [Deltaproteobacteria bacterium]